MNVVNQKFWLIKQILKQVEDDCKLILLLQKESKEQFDPEKTMTLHVYLEVIQNIMNMSDIPKNIHSMRVYMTPQIMCNV